MGAIEYSRPTSEPRQRLRLDVAGAVQGVGFRPFVHRVATREGLAGFVQNTASGASLEVEGPAEAIDRFLNSLDAELPAPADIAARTSRPVEPIGDTSFTIVDSHVAGKTTAHVLPDIATCDECLSELFDPANRRYLYPFTTCTHCGPRYTIIETLPYDRERTSMRSFEMCPACADEYVDPRSRRFHAETNACPACGPRLSLLDMSGETISSNNDTLLLAAAALRRGEIVALKAIGGFQLIVDAGDAIAVARLRERKRRPAKPFAVMAPSLETAQPLADIGAHAEELLCSRAAPIVVLRARSAAGLTPGIAPRNPNIGLMLPSSPLHHILLRQLGFPVVATSGNRSGQPLAFTDAQAVEQLAGIADMVLTHDRPIVRPADDSVVRVIAGTATTLRNGRGLAPLAIQTGADTSAGLALGGHQKNAIAVARASQIILGAHIGDLDSVETRASFEHMIADLGRLHGAAEWGASDRHPDYFSTRFAERLAVPIIPVPHHAAHVFAAMADNALDGEVLGIAWDGTGFGEDGTLWGGEFLAVDGTRLRRVAHLLPFRLPGGEIAAHEPRRCALGILHSLDDRRPLDTFTASELGVLRTMLDRGSQSPLTSSAGRLFDAVASLLNLCQIASFEGEAAMAVEFAAEQAADRLQLSPLSLSGDSPLVLDWRPTLASLMAARDNGAAESDLAAALHRALADAMVAVARRIGIPRVVLTGGCFQNARLTELANTALAAAGFDVYRHRRVPPNDGGLAVGQALFASRQMAKEWC